jgi:predicted nuclease of restriction endonuclease-like (RecB) superfamily
MSLITNNYIEILNQIKNRIKLAQTKAFFSVNSEMILMYYDIGKVVSEAQKNKGYGSNVVINLEKDIKNELPEVKGFSKRNITFMVQFYREYSQIIDENIEINENIKVKQTVSLFDNFKDFLTKIPWGHNIVLMQKIKDISDRLLYIDNIIKNSWSRDTLIRMIKHKFHKRQGALPNNFDLTLSKKQSVVTKEILKDPYIFDFLTLSKSFQERELEVELIKHLEKFLIELGSGFAFLGRQYKLIVSDKDFYIDLLFYHIKLRCFFVIELKKGDFKPEYAGKMNFYCSAVDDILKHETDNPTVGLILCENKDKIFAEYALKDINKPIGVSQYELTKALPENLKSSLPSIEDIEKELSDIE